jgi:hypothetical protein
MYNLFIFPQKLFFTFGKITKKKLLNFFKNKINIDPD